MSLNNVKKYFKEYNMEDKIIELTTSSATVEDAANSLGTTQDEIAKTLSFITPDPILIVVSGEARIDNKKFKEEFHTKAKMIPYEEVNDIIGHSPGGVCPFAIKENVKVYLDISLKKHEYVYPACGSGNSAIRLSIEELEKYSNYLKWIDVCK